MLRESLDPRPASLAVDRMRSWVRARIRKAEPQDASRSRRQPARAGGRGHRKLAGGSEGRDRPRHPIPAREPDRPTASGSSTRRVPPDIGMTGLCLLGDARVAAELPRGRRPVHPQGIEWIASSQKPDGVDPRRHARDLQHLGRDPRAGRDRGTRSTARSSTARSSTCGSSSPTRARSTRRRTASTAACRTATTSGPTSRTRSSRSRRRAPAA